jgi:hypothetical protein
MNDTRTATGTPGHPYRGVSRPVPLGWPGQVRDMSRCVPVCPDLMVAGSEAGVKPSTVTAAAPVFSAVKAAGCLWRPVGLAARLLKAPGLR